MKRIDYFVWIGNNPVFLWTRLNSECKFMYILNITFTVDFSVEDLWMKWLEVSCMKRAQEAEIFTDYKLLKVLAEVHSRESLYSVQFCAESIGACVAFEKDFLAEIKNELFVAFGEKVLFFVTHLKELDGFN